MQIPISCLNPKCSHSGELVNTVRGINPQDLNDWYESYDESDPSDHCTHCGELGVAEDPIIEHPWESKYFEAGIVL